MNKLTSIFLTTLVLGSMTANLAVAQYTPLEPLPCVPGQGLDCTGYNPNRVEFKTYVQYTFNLVIALAAAAAVFMIIYGGLIYMTADAFPIKNDGLQKVKNALFGLLLVLTSYTILKLVNPTLVQIPTTLVKQLEFKDRQLVSLTDMLDRDPTELATYLKQFYADKAAYDSDKANHQRSIDAAKSAVEAIDRSLTSLDSQIAAILGRQTMTPAEIENVCRTTENTEIKRLCAEKARLDLEKQLAGQKATLNIAIAAMRSAVYQCGALSELSCFKNIGTRSQLDNIYNEFRPKVGQLDQVLFQYYGFATGWFDANKAAATYVEKTVSLTTWRQTGVRSTTLMKDAAEAFAQNTGLVDPAVISDMNKRVEEVTAQTDRITSALENPVYMLPY